LGLTDEVIALVVEYVVMVAVVVVTEVLLSVVGVGSAIEESFPFISSISSFTSFLLCSLLSISGFTGNVISSFFLFTDDSLFSSLISFIEISDSSISISFELSSFKLVSFSSLICVILVLFSKIEVAISF